MTVTHNLSPVEIGPITEHPFISHQLDIKGKPSKVKSLCEEAIKNGYYECTWLCYNRGTKYLAQGIPILSETEGFEAHDLRRALGWWKRVSLRSPVKVKIVKMHFLKPKSIKEVEVMVLPDDSSSKIEGIRTWLEEYSMEAQCSAGYDENGTFHPCQSGSYCKNRVMGGNEEYPQFYCSLEYYHELRLRKRRLECRDAMLEFYWNSRGRSDFQTFLRESGLITSYSNLKTTHYLDAADRYGESIPALLLIDGWHIKRLLIMICFAVLMSLLVTVLAAAVGQSIDTGLTAGSYTLALVAIFIATLSFFSAVL